MFSNSGNVDLRPEILHIPLVHHKIMTLYAKVTYMHYLHWRALLALANMTEMGLLERWTPANYLMVAIEILR